MALLMDVPLLDLAMMNLAGQHSAHQLKTLLQIIRMRDVLKGQFVQFFLRVADNPAQRPIHLEPTPIGQDKGHANGGMLKRA